MNKPPFFSVVIPTYNCAELLNRSLSSVFSQTYQDFEIIVIDNSSTDNTQKVLKNISNQKLRVIRVNNKGIIGYSRNKGIDSARGEWIAFLDSDDVWRPKKLERVKDEINNNPNVILVCHDEWCVVYGERKNRLKYGPAGKDLYERLLFKGNCLSTSAVCLRRDVAIETSGFSERNDYYSAEDYEYWIRLSQIGESFFINEILGEWHIHDNNGSIGNPQKNADAIISVAEHHLDLRLKNYPSDKMKVRNAKARVWANGARILQKDRLFPNSIKYVVKAIYLNPFQWKAWVILLFSLFRISKV